MNEMLKLIVSLSLSGSILALLLLIGTPLLKGRLSGTFSYYIWLLVLLRLVVPVTASVNLMDSLLHMEKATITSTLSEPASRQTQTNNQSATDQQTSVNIQPEGTQAPQINETAEDNSSENAREQLTLWELVQNNLFWLWLAGGASSLGWFILAYSVFSTQMRRSYVCPDDADIAVFERLRGNDRRIRLACSNGASTPMLIGLLRPTIILPMCSYVKNGKGSELYNILRHELTHHRRKDILYKWFIVIATSLHWFNPLMLLIRREIGRACEISCDESVIREMSAEERKRYGNTLLALASNKRLPSGILATTLCADKKN